MNEEFVLPPPGLWRTDTLNLGPVIVPKFSDARDWSEFLPPVETNPVEFEERDLASVDHAARQAHEMALASASVEEVLRGKRYEVIRVGTRSLDRETEYPVVVIYNYTDDRVVEALVDVAEHAVREVTSLQYQPALSLSEQTRAIELVREDGRLPDQGIDADTGAGLIVDEVNYRSPRYGHRLVDLRFGPMDRRLPTAFAIVDLSAEDVVRIGLVPQEQP